MTTFLLALLLAAAPVRAISTRPQPGGKPPIVLEKQVKRATAVQFHHRHFRRSVANYPYRVEFRLLDGRKAIVAFARPLTDEKSISWSGRVEGTRFGTGTIVLYEGVVSGSLRFDDGRVFDLVTAERDVWMREIDTAALGREGEAREAREAK
jgi:hypothetical protein